MALIGASRLLLAYGIDYAARVQNGYVSPGTAGTRVHPKSSRTAQFPARTCPRVPARGRPSLNRLPLVMKGSPVRVRASALSICRPFHGAVVSGPLFVRTRCEHHP